MQLNIKLQPYIPFCVFKMQFVLFAKFYSLRNGDHLGINNLSNRFSRIRTEKDTQKSKYINTS